MGIDSVSHANGVLFTVCRVAAKKENKKVNTGRVQYGNFTRSKLGVSITAYCVTSDPHDLSTH